MNLEQKVAELEKKATVSTATSQISTSTLRVDEIMTSGNKEILQLAVYFSGPTFTRDVPLNIENTVKNTFSFYQVEFEAEGNVVVRVPKLELEMAKKFSKDVTSLLQVIKKDNSILAEKLALRFGFKLPK